MHSEKVSKFIQFVYSKLSFFICGISAFYNVIPFVSSNTGFWACRKYGHPYLNFCHATFFAPLFNYLNNCFL